MVGEAAVVVAEEASELTVVEAVRQARVARRETAMEADMMVGE